MPACDRHVNDIPSCLSANHGANAVRRVLWDHFMHADLQMLYDYWWGVADFPWLPTAAEVEGEDPNAAGWGTGMENCALSAAQVLPGALLRHELAPDERTEQEARALYSGLQRLFTAADDPGFLPRGLALDGISHYPNSSADQYTMVFHALHAYHCSHVATPAEQQAIQEIWQCTLRRWERDAWEDRREDGDPAMFGDMDRVTSDRSGRLLAALLGGFVVTGDGHWHDVYRQKLEEDDFARLRVGLPPEGAALYVYDQNQVAWRLLWELETDHDIRERYRGLMQVTAAAVRNRLLDYRQFDAEEHSRRLAATEWNWRRACVTPAQPCDQTRDRTCGQAEPGAGPNQGAAYNTRIRQQAPVIEYEHAFVQSPWEAAHILVLSAEADHHRLLQEHLTALLTTFPWDQIALSWSVYNVEWTYWLSRQPGQTST